MLSFGNSRYIKGIASFVFSLVLSLSAYNVSASGTATSIESLNWLPLLTASMKSFQPDLQCLDNYIAGVKVDKKDQLINTKINEINWDLNCTASSSNNSQNSQPISDEQRQKQLELLLQKLSALPEFNVRVKKFNLLSKLINKTFSSQFSINKSDSQLVVALTSDPLRADLTIDLKNKVFTLSGTANLVAISDYIQVTEQTKKYLQDGVTFHYQSELSDWQKGAFKIGWQGALDGFSEQVDLSVVGSVDLLKEKITLSTFSVNTKNIVVPISEKQSWETGYIKLKLSEPAHFNYGEFSIERLPLHLRLGRSVLLTKVARGKSQRIRIDKQKIPALFAPFTVSGKANALLVDWSLVLLTQKLSGELSIIDNIVRLNVLDNHIDLTTLISSTKKYIDALAPLTIKQGSLLTSLNVEYNLKNGDLHLASEFKSDAVSGAHDTILFDGLSIDSQLNYFWDKQKRLNIEEDKQRLKIKNLFVGFPIQDLQIDAQVGAGKSVIDHFKAELLGGHVNFDDFKLNAPSTTTLHINGLRLAEMIQYSAYPEIEIEGILDGKLPLILTPEGPEVEDGVIYSRLPGGYIKVPENTVVKAIGSGNSELSFMLKVLSDFQFDTMKGKIGYTNDGESDLKVKIEGTSPNLSGTQPIIFNYSHNENILKLLQSLRFNEQLARDIKERY